MTTPNSAAITKTVSEFISSLDFRSLPSDAIRIASLGFTDVAGVMIAGSREPVTQIVSRTFISEHGAKAHEATLQFGPQRVNAPDAALINGCAAHALDYDDAGGHRSSVLVPAILAEGELLASSGQDMLTAYVAGYEVWSELARREKGQLHERGWHPTGIYGVLAAASAIARLRRLNAAQTASTLGIAASCASGLVANFGTMTKPFHAGHAARTGIIAARLAVNGMTASQAVLEHPRGFLAAVSQHGDFDVESAPDIGRVWRIPVEGLSVKKYPTCYFTHRAIDSALELRACGLTADAIGRIRVRFGKTQKLVVDADHPRTGLEAKFSIQFAVACALARGRVSLAEVNDQTLQDPEIQRLMAAVDLDLTDEYDELMPQYAPWDQVTVTLESGKTLQGPQVRRARGHIQNPLSTDELRAKFMACLKYAESTVNGPRLFDALQSLVGQPGGWVRAHVTSQDAASRA